MVYVLLRSPEGDCVCVSKTRSIGPCVQLSRVLDSNFYFTILLNFYPVLFLILLYIFPIEMRPYLKTSNSVKSKETNDEVLESHNKFQTKVICTFFRNPTKT